ncbi:hypothetical protein ZWY2020_042213 [Hordeum vulgare]|nr:hypothetical protein ZWY2020_042213 [Hordeum vulgare]
MLATTTPRPSLRRSSPAVAAEPAPGPDLLLPSQRPSGPRRSRPGFLLPLPPEIHSGFVNNGGEQMDGKKMGGHGY